MPVVESREQKLLGNAVDKKLTYNTHVEPLCKKADQTLHALSRISCYLSTEQLKLTMKTFILSQSDCCPLVWMFCDLTLDDKINRIHEKALRIAPQNTIADLNALLLESNSVSMHTRNLQLQMIEVYKTVQNGNPSFIKKIFVQKKITHNIKKNLPMRNPKMRTSSYGIESWSFLGCKL